ncbi:hypothetical protein ACFX2C_031296 [Malus domestica]
MFEELSENSQQFSTRGRSTTRRQGVYEINTNDGVHAEMAAMNTKIDMLVKTMSSLSGKQASRTEVCAICSHSNHTIETCPMSSFTDQEHANIIQRTIHSPIQTIKDGEITPILHGEMGRIFRIHRSNK